MARAHAAATRSTSASESEPPGLRLASRLPWPEVTTHGATGEAWPALAVRGLAKAFGPKIAVAEINLDVPRGSFFGIVGPNGAGKTTTLRMATGLLRPDRGQVWVDGIDVWTDPIAAKARIGVLPEDLALFERLRGRELLEFHGLLRNMPTDVIAEPRRRAARPARPGRRGRRARRRLQPRHAQEARARGRDAARPAPAVPRRAVRGDRPGVGARDPLGARALHGRRRHDRVLQPRDGARRAHVRSRRGDGQRPHRVGRPARRSSAPAASLEDAFVALVGEPEERQGLSWLEHSSD